jgi:hypothetical protein
VKNFKISKIQGQVDKEQVAKLAELIGIVILAIFLQIVLFLPGTI